MTADEYERLAAECLLIAEGTTDPKNKIVLIHMSQCWLRLANQKRLSAGHETHPPPPGAGEMAVVQQQQQQIQPGKED